jgi:hypothetical protein
MKEEMYPNNGTQIVAKHTVPRTKATTDGRHAEVRQ